MTNTTSAFDRRVAELRAAGRSHQQANSQALAEERQRNEQIADATYRQD